MMVWRWIHGRGPGFFRYETTGAKPPTKRSRVITHPSENGVDSHFGATLPATGSSSFESKFSVSSSVLCKTNPLPRCKNSLTTVTSIGESKRHLSYLDE